MDLPSRYSWRPLEPTDADAVVALYQRWEAHHQLLFRSDRAEVEHDLSDPDAELPTRSIGGWDGSGTLRGLGWVFRRDQPGVPKHRAIVWPIADPEDPDLEADLIRWCTRVAESLLSGISDGLERIMRSWSPANVTDRISRFAVHGYEVARYFSSLSRPVLGADPPDPPPGVALADWDLDGHGRAIWEAHVEAFSDHWGVVPPDWETWRRDHAGDPHTRLDLSVVAVAGHEVIGYSLNQVWPEDAQVRGLTEGYIGALGVRRGWRRRGIATALILESIRRFASEGFDNATLDVDAANETGAFELYERLGFGVVDSSVALVREL